MFEKQKYGSSLRVLIACINVVVKTLNVFTTTLMQAINTRRLPPDIPEK